MSPPFATEKFSAENPAWPSSPPRNPASFERVEPLAFRFQLLQQLFIFRVGDSGEVEINRMQRKRGNRGIGIRIFPGVPVALVSLTGSSWMSFSPTFLPQSASSFKSANSPTPKLFSLRKLKTGTATPAPRQWCGGSTRKTVVDDGVSVRRDFVFQNPVRAVLVTDEGIFCDIETRRICRPAEKSVRANPVARRNNLRPACAPAKRVTACSSGQAPRLRRAGKGSGLGRAAAI